jgi:intracellular multiplication protein IcmE
VQTDRSAPQAGSSNTAAAYAYAPPASTASHYLTPDETKAIQAMIKQWAGVNTANEAGYSAGITKATVDQEETYAASMDQAAGEGLRVTSNNTANGATVMEALRQQVIVAPYAITYAQLKTEIDTDESSVVRAVVPEGMPYAGAVLYATGYKRLENDVDMTFDAMVYGGRAFKVTAKPLDLKSSRTALSGDVHHHYFARIVLPALANGIGNTAQMFATAGAQNIVTSQGGVISTNPTTPSVRNIAGTFVGGAGQSAGQVLSQEAAQIPVKQTIVPKDEMIGIQFIGSVTAADDMSLTNADSKPQQAAPARAASTSVPPITPPRPSPNVALPGGMRYTALPVTSAVGGL